MAVPMTEVEKDVRFLSIRLPKAKAYALFLVNEHGTLELSVAGTMQLLAEEIAPALQKEAAELESAWQEELDD